MADEGDYGALLDILEEAARQSSEGKGKERHATDGEAFEEQQICQIPRWMGSTVPQANAPIFQGAKKGIEATRLSPEAAIRELRGGIVYYAAAIRLIEEQIARTS